jgi:tetratricopeptide (TPR) repeat protein
MKRKILVFIASPSDLAKERNLFRSVIDNLNVGFGDGANVEFEALGWEDTLALTGRRSQSVINEEIDKCDVFILAMHRRWGQQAKDAHPYTSYTEEEFYRALALLEKQQKPEIFVFFKRVDPASEADAGPQLQKVMDFKRQLEDSRQVLYHYFDDEAGFTELVDKHLRAFTKGGLPKTKLAEHSVLIPESVLQQIEQEKQRVTQKEQQAERAQHSEQTALLKLEQAQLQMAEDAAILALEGKTEFARQKFSQLTTESDNLRILYLAYEFYNRTGDLDTAFSITEKWLALSGENQQTAATAAAFCNLGVLYKTRGNLPAAEEMYQKSLKINEALGLHEDIASICGNLGNLYQMRGDYLAAEEMHQKSLQIDEALGLQEGMASDYGNLGNLYQIQGDLDTAEEMYQKSLEVSETLGWQEGMASGYGNLGSLYRRRGELDAAEDMCKKSLAIVEAIDRREGMANQYCNLGNLCCDKGDFDQAKQFYQQAIVFYNQLGSPNADLIQQWLDELNEE